MPSSKLYVGNLSYSATSAQLEQLFSQYGKVVNINIIGDKGFGFVEMSNASEAQTAKDELNGQEFLGRKIAVDEARPPKQGGGRGGRSGGGRGSFGGGRRW